MRSQFLTGIIFIASSSFLIDKNPTQSNLCSRHYNSGSSVSGFAVTRLSGDRVMVFWHTEDEQDQTQFEVMRKHGKAKPFTSLGIVTPKSKEDNTADYSFIDMNNFSDSSFYCLKKTCVDSVVFYSMPRGVEGIGKER